MGHFDEHIPDHIATLSAENDRLEKLPIDKEIEKRIAELHSQIREIENEKLQAIELLEDEIGELEEELAIRPRAIDRAEKIKENQELIKRLRMRQGKEIPI